MIHQNPHPILTMKHRTHQPTISNQICSLAPLLTLLLANTAPAITIAQTFTSGFANSGVIPDGDLSGWQNSQTLTLGGDLRIDSLAVTLNLSGGWNGDLYLTLRHETAGGTGFAVLLNRVGMSVGDEFGYEDAGFGPDDNLNPFRLSDAGVFDVHSYGANSPVFNANGQLTGTWRPDGGNFASFQGLDPSGTWTLFAADLASGDVTTVGAWGLELNAVPDGTSTLALLGVALGGIGLLRRKL
jgi:VPDSG-CTERM motif